MGIIDDEQADFARKQLEADEREKQSAMDRAEIKVKLLENGVLVKTGQGWFSFKTWSEASFHINSRIKALLSKRTGIRP